MRNKVINLLYIHFELAFDIILLKKFEITSTECEVITGPGTWRQQINEVNYRIFWTDPQTMHHTLSPPFPRYVLGSQRALWAVAFVGVVCYNLLYLTRCLPICLHVVVKTCFDYFWQNGYGTYRPTIFHIKLIIFDRNYDGDYARSRESDTFYTFIKRHQCYLDLGLEYFLFL